MIAMPYVRTAAGTLIEFFTGRRLFRSKLLIMIQTVCLSGFLLLRLLCNGSALTGDRRCVFILGVLLFLFAASLRLLYADLANMRRMHIHVPRTLPVVYGFLILLAGGYTWSGFLIFSSLQ